MLNSKIYIGSVLHDRKEPVRHRFKYPLYMFGIDLSEIARLHQTNKLFGYNKFRPFSIYDADYLRGEGSLEEKLRRELQIRGFNLEIAEILLVTSARFFGYVFNPVSFYLCRSSAGKLVYTIAEINNTYGERHIYVLDHSSNKNSSVPIALKKTFFVSPFNQVEHDYEFVVKVSDSQLKISININDHSKLLFHSYLSGKARKWGTLTQILTVIQFPLAAVLTIPRIYWQAQQLRFRRGLTMLDKPNPTSPDTIQVAKPTLRERLAMRRVEGILQRFTKGQLTIIYPNGVKKVFGAPATSDRTAELRLVNYKLFTRLVRDGGIGLGEGYVDGDWRCDDLPIVLKVILENIGSGDEKRMNRNWLARVWHRFGHWLKRNTLSGARQNIAAHYDLSNEFFKLFLDPSLTYSSAVFKKADDTLEEAQRNKLNLVLDKARVEPGNHILEIGSGWGSLALLASKERQCKVTTLTLSEEQAKAVNQRKFANGVADKIDVKLVDYRDMTGKFDRIISIEMMEAIGYKYLPEYFRKLEELCKPDGVVVLQVITMLDQWYDQYLERQDWIQKYIFPGSHLPSLTHLSAVITKETGFVVESLENIAPHYALTLAEWRRRFMAKLPEVSALGFNQRFQRIWEYYLASCEAEFGTRLLNVVQLVLTRPNNPTLLRRDQELYATGSLEPGTAQAIRA